MNQCKRAGDRRHFVVRLDGGVIPDDVVRGVFVFGDRSCEVAADRSLGEKSVFAAKSVNMCQLFRHRT